jgi:hypothetical protein
VRERKKKKKRKKKQNLLTSVAQRRVLLGVDDGLEVVTKGLFIFVVEREGEA